MQALTTTDVLVTTSFNPSPEQAARARALAARGGSSYAPRGRNTLAVLVQRYAAKAALVVSPTKLHLVYAGHSYYFHPNMAVHRIGALKAGATDRLIEAAELQSGDTLLDCTCGLGADAVVAAFVVGIHGAVQTLEASPLLAAMVEHGLHYYHHRDTELVAALRRVKLLNTDYATFLPQLASNSWDVVYFDPMFDTTLAHSAGLELVRLLGSYTQPSQAILSEARRVARRSVIVADRAPGHFLSAMNIPHISTLKRVWYGRLDAA